MTKEDESLLTYILTLETERELQAFLEGLLGQSNFDNIILRWRVLNKLKQNVSQRTIAKEENIALSRVNQIAKILQQENNFAKKLLDKRYDETEL